MTLFSLCGTLIMASVMANSGNPWFFVDAALIGFALYGLTKRIYWVAIALCVYWVFSILIMISAMNIVAWVVKLWFLYYFIMASRAIGFLENEAREHVSADEMEA